MPQLKIMLNELETCKRFSRTVATRTCTLHQVHQKPKPRPGTSSNPKLSIEESLEYRSLLKELLLFINIYMLIYEMNYANKHKSSQRKTKNLEKSKEIKGVV